MMKRLFALVVGLVLAFSLSTAALADITIAEQTDKVISMRLEKGADEVLSFYDSWSAQEFAAGKKPARALR